MANLQAITVTKIIHVPDQHIYIYIVLQYNWLQPFGENYHNSF